MSLEETKKELEEQIQEALKAEEKATEEPKEEVVEEQQKEVPDEKPLPDEPKDEPKAEEEKPVKTPSEYAEERRQNKARLAAELAARNAELAAANARIAELTKPKAENNEVIPNKEEDPMGWTEHQLKKTQEKLAQIERYTEAEAQRRWKENQKKQANNEIIAYEEAVRREAKDYDDAKNFYARAVAASLKVMAPGLNGAQLEEAVADRMMLRASELYNQGYENPVKAMYDEAKSWGYKKQQAEPVEEKEIKPDLERVAANRKRNAGTAGASSAGEGGEMTPTYAATLTNAEFAKLSASQKQKIFSQLGA